MGKVGGSSWLTAVKRAFRSPNKDHHEKSIRRREDHEQDDEEKKRGKRRWIFRKCSYQETVIHHSEGKAKTTSAAKITSTPNTVNSMAEAADVKQRHALAVAMATTAAAQAAVASAQAAVEVARLTRPSLLVKQHFAAIAIQTAFRGYLARRALRALRGLVKLQALVRGHNVRQRAKMALECMQALIRVQARVCDQRKRLSYEGNSNHNNLWSIHPTDRKSSSMDEISDSDEYLHWNNNPQALEEIKTIQQEKSEIAMKREKALSYAFSHQLHKQMWVSDHKEITYASEGELEGKPRRLDWCTRRRSLENRASTALLDNRECVKTVEMDTSRPYSYSTPSIHDVPHQYATYQQHRPSSFSVASPLHRTHNNIRSLKEPVTPSPSKARTILQVHSASPRCLRQDRNPENREIPLGPGATSMPNYMTATVSAKARLRAHSAPRQRQSTPEREKTSTVKKRLYFAVPDTGTIIKSGSSDNSSIVDYSLRSPSYKGSTMWCGYTSTMNDVSSPRSTDDLGRRLR